MSESIKGTDYFVLDELDSSAGSLQKLCRLLPEIHSSYQKNYKTNDSIARAAVFQLQASVSSLWEQLKTIILLLEECGDYTLSSVAKKLLEAAQHFDYLGATSYDKLVRALQNFIDSLPTSQRNLDDSVKGRLLNRINLGYYPTDQEHVELIKRALAFPSTAVNVLDPCCGEGFALSSLVSGQDAHSFGIELDRGRAEQAVKRIERIGMGSFFHSRISHKAFHCIFLNPPYLSVKTKNGSRRLEKAFLSDSLLHLMMNGLMIYIIPYYRLSSDVCQVLSSNLTGIAVYRFLDREFQKFHQIAILGYRCERNDNPKQAAVLAECAFFPEKLPLLSELPEKSVILPECEKKVDVFKGAEFNTIELAEQLRRSSSVDKLFSCRVLDSRERRPLLPLNLSQIGLVGASGLINGLVECETPHVIKGRIIKQKKSQVTQVAKNVTEVSEVTSNKLIFNILTPDGFQSLT